MGPFETGPEVLHYKKKSQKKKQLISLDTENVKRKKKVLWLQFKGNFAN